MPGLIAWFLLGLTLIIVRRIAGSTGFVIVPRRWVAERTLDWLSRWRRLSNDDEERPPRPWSPSPWSAWCSTASFTQTESAYWHLDFQNRQ